MFYVQRLDQKLFLEPILLNLKLPAYGLNITNLVSFLNMKVILTYVMNVFF